MSKKYFLPKKDQMRTWYPWKGVMMPLNEVFSRSFEESGESKDTRLLIGKCRDTHLWVSGSHLIPFLLLEHLNKGSTWPRKRCDFLTGCRESFFVSVQCFEMEKVTFECDVYCKLRLMSSSLIHRSSSHSPSHSSVGRASDFRYPARFEPRFESLRRSIY